jgi:8-oxo-dGTP diphosphatase
MTKLSTPPNRQKKNGRDNLLECYVVVDWPEGASLFQPTCFHPNLTDYIMSKPIIVTAAIMVKANQVFAARRNSGSHMAGFWEFPGGKIEIGETPEECLARELFEEFGIVTQIGEFFAESTHDYGTKTIQLLAYWVTHVSGEFELMAHDQLRWLSFDELDQVKWAPADIPLVSLYRDHL